jgi:hypothetical protein
MLVDVEFKDFFGGLRRLPTLVIETYMKIPGAL